MMQRINTFHKSPRENINIFFNMVQACRTDLEIMRYKSEYQELLAKDTELHKIVEGLAREMKSSVSK